MFGDKYFSPSSDIIFSAVVSAKQSTTSTSQGAARSVSLDEQEDNQKTVLLFGPLGHWLVVGPGKEIKKPDSDLRHHFHLQSPETK